MAGVESIAPKESFEQYEERFIFEGSSYFLYNKYNHECKEETTSFTQALKPKFSSRNERLYLHQQPNEPTNAKIIRSVTINCGSNVVSVYFSSMALTDKIVEGVLPHLSKLQYLQFNGINTGSVAAQATALYCHGTLKSLRVRGCHIWTSESCGWLAGMIGHHSPTLSRLKALDLSLTKVDDRGLSFLSKGLGQLECLDMERCSITGKGMVDSLRGGSFSSMMVLNLRGCKFIDDDGVVAISNVMSKLTHLNLSQCGNITNKSASAIGQGCTQLTTLSLEGALAITDAGLGMVANYTKLDLLNITGCSISRKSLMAVVLALGYVQESSNFFGFIIRGSDSKSAALLKEAMSSTREQQNRAAHVIQGGWKVRRHTIGVIQAAHRYREQKAASRIQSFLLNRRFRKRFEELRYIGLAKINTPIIQRLVRGWLARRRLKRLMLRFRRISYFAKIIQAIYRGKRTRLHDKLVMPAILRLRAKRLFEKRTNAAIKIQCFQRRRVAISRLDWLRKDFILRWDSSTLIQMAWRSMLARLRLKRFRLFAEMYYYYCRKMAIKIQCALRQYFARKELDKCLELAAERHLAKHKNARKIQSWYRGGCARVFVRRKKYEWNNAAVEIQRIFRGTLVQSWQDIKWDLISRHVHEMADSELTAVRSRLGHKMETSGETGTIEDEADGSSFIGGTPEETGLLKYVFGQYFVRLHCLIYWPDIGLYKPGCIGGYDDRMRLWKIVYDDDDSEWLDLTRNPERVMVREENSQEWWIPFAYYHPMPMVQYLEKRRTFDPANSTSSTPHESRDQIISDLWYSIYVSRGLLDEYYRTQSYESLEKLRSAHTAKTLTTSLALLVRVGGQEADLIHQVEHLLIEVEGVMMIMNSMRG